MFGGECGMKGLGASPLLAKWLHKKLAVSYCFLKNVTKFIEVMLVNRVIYVSSVHFYGT